MASQNDLMTTAEVARKYGIIERSVLNAVSRKELSPPIIKNRRSCFHQFRRKDVVAWRSDVEASKKKRGEKKGPYDLLNQTRIRWCIGCGLLLLGKVTLEQDQKAHPYCSAGCRRARFARNADTEHEWAYLQYTPPRAAPQVELFEKIELTQAIRAVLWTLTLRQERTLRLLYGIGHTREHTHREIASAYGVSVSRIGQIEAKALRVLRHPSRSNRLTPFAPEKCKPAPLPLFVAPPPPPLPLANEQMDFRVRFNSTKRVVDVFLVNFHTAHPEQDHMLGQAITNLASMLVTHNHPLPTSDFLWDGQWRSVKDIRMFTNAWHRVEMPKTLILPAGATTVSDDGDE